MNLTAPVIELERIRKAFPNGVVANEDVSFSATKGQIHSIVGENGAGKSTLMNILYGLIQPDSGRIVIDKKVVTVKSPSHGLQLGIGMVTQHTTMIPALSVFENIILGNETTSFGLLNTIASKQNIASVCERLNIDLPLTIKAGTASIAVLQKAEIVKAICRGARILILDEPTAALSPNESASLFSVLKKLAESGTTIIFITHKMQEVFAFSSTVTIIRAGKSYGQFNTDDVDESFVLKRIVGQDQGTDFEFFQKSTKDIAGQPVLDIQGISFSSNNARAQLHNIELQVKAGEILGIAGIDGSGQRELASCIAGLHSPTSGSIIFSGKDITNLTPTERIQLGITYIPENRHEDGIVMEFSIAENLILGRESENSFSQNGSLRTKEIQNIGDETVRLNRIKANNGSDLAGTLSGGNQQKVVIGRATRNNPRLVVAMQPTRGLDVAASKFVYDLFAKLTDSGASVLLFSLDLDELLNVSDRIAIMFDGRISGIVERDEFSKDTIGKQMVGANQ